MLDEKIRDMQTKIERGQFYTLTNPFELQRFNAWLSSIPNYTNLSYLEPFGGANNIIDMVAKSYPEIELSRWRSFDIHPESQRDNMVPLVPVEKRDTLAEFPAGFDICITNPPYLAKNSASRKGSSIDFEGFQDLFEISLSRMLEKCSWIAAIIPESFLTRSIFKDRLEFIISLNMEMFGDTEFPVCLAAFSPKYSADFEIWAGNTLLGNMADLKSFEETNFYSPRKGLFTFNDPKGALGLTAIDSTAEASIGFHAGELIPESDIKVTSRALTRISSRHLPNTESEMKNLIKIANKNVQLYRDGTKDVFLTSFKGLRKDGLYRRRMDWNTASKILATSLAELSPDLAAEIIASPRLI